MTLPTSSMTQRLPLLSRHVKLGAKLGHFGDWEVPLYYSSILEEHEAVRTRAGLFDISHMGKFSFSGQRLIQLLEDLLPRPISTMTDGQALYMPLLNENGGFVDDIIVYRFSSKDYLMIVNASNMEKDFEWISSRLPSGLDFKNDSAGKGLIALQGPASAEILEKVLGDPQFSCLGYYRCARWRSGMIARTGYTGEDGFEILAERRDLEEMWDSILDKGSARGVVPAGFGARDTLRLEAAMPLYGHDMNDEITPLEAGLEWAIDWKKNNFTGKEALLEQKRTGIIRRLIGFEMLDRGIPRQDYEIKKGEAVIGKVTSGTFSPTLKKNIGLGYVPAEMAVPGTEIEIHIRDKNLKAKILKLPFYKRKK